MKQATNGRRLRREQGYTLIELVMVLAIIGVMFALITPSLSKLYQHCQLDAAARTVTTDIRSQQMSAWSHQNVHEIRLNKFAPKYTIWEAGQYRSQQRLSDRIQYRNGYLEQTVSQLRFDPSGVTSGSGSIRLVNQEGEQADVVVHIATGTVVFEGVYPR